MQNRPNVLFIMTDQQRFDTIAALGNSDIYTPNLDRLVKRGISFTRSYSTCPVCVPARYMIRTGCEPPTTACYTNEPPTPLPGQAETINERCGKYLARTMTDLGYRTFGIGKFHTCPEWDEELGYEIHLHTEELFGTPDQRSRDSYAAFLTKEHPEYDFIEQLHGERTEMYYMPQMSPLPAEITAEGFVAKKAAEHISADDNRPYFGMVSFIGPHPPFAPPIPFNRMYDPDKMPNPIRGNLKIDHADEQIPWMNHIIWAEDINDSHARVLKARYYGEISYIDNCLGQILDAVEARPDTDNTVICFYSDHGDHLGDHNAWQKESFFEQTCHIPMLVSWPGKLPKDTRRDELVCLTDLFGIATTAAGAPEFRDGTDVLGMLEGKAEKRQYLFGYYGRPGTDTCKIMVRDNDWKYIYLVNGDRQQLFNITEDPNELNEVIEKYPEVAERMRKAAIEKSLFADTKQVTNGQKFIPMPYKPHKKFRIHQFDRSRGIEGFPKKPEDVLKS